MVAQQLRDRDIADERVLAAMERVPRELFVPASLRDRAYDDAALPLPAGQSISQPYIVAKIAETLGLHGDELVLDVGTGSGYGAAVLAELAREVVSIERIPELAAQAREDLAAAGYERVQRPRRRRHARRPGARALRRHRGRRCGAEPPRGALRAARPERPHGRAARRPVRPAARARRAQPGRPGGAPLDTGAIRPADRGRPVRVSRPLRSTAVERSEAVADHSARAPAAPARGRGAPATAQLDPAREVQRRRRDRLRRQPRRLLAADQRRAPLPARGGVFLLRRGDEQLPVEPAMDVPRPARPRRLPGHALLRRLAAGARREPRHPATSWSASAWGRSSRRRSRSCSSCR